MEALERASSPRWPTNMTDIIWTMFCRIHAAMSGPARYSCFLTSATTRLSLTPLVLRTPLPRRGSSMLGIMHETLHPASEQGVWNNVSNRWDQSYKGWTEQGMCSNVSVNVINLIKAGKLESWRNQKKTKAVAWQPSLTLSNKQDRTNAWTHLIDLLEENRLKKCCRTICRIYRDN